MKDVIIVGGGVAGLGAALTLGSSEGKRLGDINTLVIDDGKSDLKKAVLYNVPFVKKGITGIEALKQMKKDALEFKSVSYIEDTIVNVDGEEGNFIIKGKEGEYKSKFIVLASGANKFDILLNGEKAPILEHRLMPKDGKIRLGFKSRQEFKPGIYVAGLLSGVTTMYATALGSGVEAACALMSKMGGKTTIIHDFEGSRL